MRSSEANVLPTSGILDVLDLLDDGASDDDE